MKKLWIKNREVIIVIASLCVLMFFVLWLLLGFIEHYPFVSFSVCLIFIAVYSFIRGKNKK